LSTPASRRTVAIVAVVLGIVINLGVSCNGFREDEVECEQAIAHVAECCPDFHAGEVDCTYTDHIDCNDNVTGTEYPALSIDDSHCLQKKRCDELVTSGDCTRAQAARARDAGAPGTEKTAGATKLSPSKTCKPTE
jgi:hypothetical protein